ncbi:MAG: iron dependent repressor, metal binding and dimerization domain protein [Opitutaceae bacterium]
MRQRFKVEDALKQFHRAEYEGRMVVADVLSGSVVRNLEEAGILLARLQEDGFIEPAGRGFRLTESGRRYALQVVRAHRLFETWLARETGTEAASWHRKAEQAEHLLSAEETEALSASLGHPRFDPHGDPIPTRHLTLPELGEIALLEADPDTLVRITHIEDEPATVFRKIASMGLAPGVILKVRRSGGRDVEIEAESRTHRLSRVEAAHIQVVAEAEEDAIQADWIRLSELRDGEGATIRALSAVCQGAERLRLLDLGVVPGSRVRVDLTGPFSSPRGYRIRGTLVGLRHDQSENIFVARDTAI